MKADNETMKRELARILWRQVMLSFPEGLKWLIANARVKEKDVGPHRADAPVKSK